MMLSREQYDWLVSKYPNWMGTRWPKFRRTWHVNGVRVIASDNLLSELSSFLKKG